MTDVISFMSLPALACLLLCLIHAYLGFHVMERQVVFADLALAQMAVLGMGIALVAGYSPESGISYLFSLVFSLAGAWLLTLTRFKKQHVLQEALIGIIYVVSAAVLVLVLSRNGGGDEHIRQSLVGNILLVSREEVFKIFVLYALIGSCHYYFREKFFLVSSQPQEALRQGISVRFWDFLFYASFALVVTSSVRIAGVLLVFSFLVVPSVCAMLISKKLDKRLMIGWGFGMLASGLGLAGSYYFDFPTGASVVCAFGLLLIGVIVLQWGKSKVG